MWLLHIEQTDGCKIMHARNGREYRLSDLPNFSVNGYFAETRTFYDFFSVAITTDTLAKHFEMSAQQVARLCPIVMKARWHDPNR